MKCHLRNGRVPIRLSLMAFCLAAAVTGTAQSRSLGIILPDSSAQLHLSSTSEGFLPPRLTTIPRNAIISPATGLMVFNTKKPPGCV